MHIHSLLCSKKLAGYFSDDGKPIYILALGDFIMMPPKSRKYPKNLAEAFAKAYSEPNSQ